MKAMFVADLITALFLTGLTFWFLSSTVTASNAGDKATAAGWGFAMIFAIIGAGVVYYEAYNRYS